MSRHWLLTTTFYGNWLPGDHRGFVSRVRDQREDDPDTVVRLVHAIPGTPYDQDISGLRRSAIENLKCPPIRITLQHAELLANQFQETASFRKWVIHALAIMVDHIHIVVEVPDDPDPEKILGDFKAWGSRPLNREYGKPPSGTWWTYGGSKRKLPDAEALRRASFYVLFKQPHPLVVWPPPASGVA